MPRQSELTKTAIKDAFSTLVFEEKYEDIRVGDIVDLANVGRSTFYKHYADRHAVLIDNMGWLLDLLSASAGIGEYQDEVAEALAHIWQFRGRGRRILQGVPGAKFGVALTARIDQVIQKDWQDHDLALPRVFLANQISASVMSVLMIWLSGEGVANERQLARSMCASSRAILLSAKR